MREYVTEYPDVPRGMRIDEMLRNREWCNFDTVRLEGAPFGWTEEEIEQIGEWAGEISMAEMGRRLGRTRHAIHWAMMRMHPDRDGLMPRVTTWRLRWKPEDLQYIMDHYILSKTTRAPQLAARFGVTTRQVRTVIRNLRQENCV